MKETIAINTCEVLQCQLTMMELIKLKGVPCVFSFQKGDWIPDFRVVKQVTTWYDPKTDTHYFEWEKRQDARSV